MGASDRRFWVDDGLLVWDGRALELFKTDGRHDGWRVDAAVVERWIFDVGVAGSATLKIYTSDGHYASTMVPPDQRADVAAVLAAVDEIRGAV